LTTSWVCPPANCKEVHTINFIKMS
jgi:hypothetical protein